MQKIQGNDGTQVIVFPLLIPKTKKCKVTALLSEEEKHYGPFLKEIRKKYKIFCRENQISDLLFYSSGSFLFLSVLLKILNHFVFKMGLLESVYLGCAFTFIFVMLLLYVFKPIIGKKTTRLEEEILKRIRIENKEELPRNQYWELWKGSLLLHYQPKDWGNEKH